MKPKILITDDEKPTRDVMARILSPKYDCLKAADGEIALKTLEENPDVALLITDYRMPGMNGIELIKAAKARKPAIACMLITAYGEIDLAVQAMKEGANDFLTKPITDIDQLELRVAKLVALAPAQELQPPARSKLANFTGSSSAMERVYSLIEKVAPTNANILIQGPSGSGKELTARAIHDLSRRSNGPFIAVECSSLPSSLLETELFGSIKGAYTDARDRAGCFEAANGGTLFLDEIGEIDANVQVKLLRVLETRSFQRVGSSETLHSDFRLVTATNKNLAELVVAGKFREDLFYRLNVIDIELPSLKERPGDIALLAKRFVKEFSSQNGNSVTGITDAAIAALEKYPWPGNVRQLRNAIEKMTILSSGGELDLADIPEEIRSPRLPSIASTPLSSLAAPKPAAAPAASQSGAEAQPPHTLAESEKSIVIAALREAAGNVTKAAKLLGISRRTLHRRINDWGLK